MSKDVRIIPADGDIQFYNAAASASGKIQQVNDDLVLSNAVGDILFGDTDSDVYIGDGISNVDIIFEQNGEIRGEAGSNVTLTLGSKDTTIYVTGSTVALQKDGGNVGIGTTAPAYKLDVNGTTRISGDLHLDSAGDFITFYGNENSNHSISSRDINGTAADDLRINSYGSVFVNLDSNSNNTDAAFVIGEHGGDTNTITERFRVQDDGNVGIGTNSPTEKLDVEGSIRVGDTLKIQNASGGRIGFNRNPSNGDIYNNTIPGAYQVQNNLGIFEILTYNANGTTLGNLYIRSGSLGIGVLPTSKLHVNGNADITGSLFLSRTATYNSQWQIFTSHTSTANYGSLYFTPSLTTSNYYFRNSANIDLFFISGSGKVGVGTNTPNERLEVAGNIRLQNSGRVYLWQNNSNNYIDYANWIASTGNSQVIQNTGAGGITFKTLTTARMFISSSGDIGIGTVDPTEKLHVNGTFRSNGIWTTPSAVTQWGGGSTAYGALTWSTGYAKVYATTGNVLHLAANGASTDVTIDTSGNVGIGTTTPSSSLHVEGNVQIGSNRLKLGAGNADSYIQHNGSNLITHFQSNWGGDFKFRAADTGGTQYDILFIEGSNQRVGIGTTSPSYKFEVAGTNGSFGVGSTGNDIYFTRAGGNYFYGTQTNSAFLFYTNGNLGISQVASGKVGIGTASPSYNLEVSGSIGVKNDLYITHDNGSNPTDAGSIYFKEAGTTWGTDYYGFRINQEGSSNFLNFQSANTTTVKDILTLTRDTARVGIGTTAPAEKLEVYSGSIKLNDGSRNLIIGEEGSSSYQIKSSGYLVIDATSGIQLNKTTNGNISILNGSVGIGTSTPAYKLDVSGTGRFTGEVVAGGTLTIAKSGTDSYLRFPAQLNDAGYIRHYESSNIARMLFVVSDDNSTQDYFGFGYSGNQDRFRIYANGQWDSQGSGTVNGNLTVTGIVTAQEFHTEFVSASIVYSSGSTKFGDTADDVHSFTGSLEVQSGSIRIETYENGLQFFNGTNYTTNRIRLTSTENLQIQAGSVIQLQTITQLTNGNIFRFNNTDNTTRFDINNAGASGEYRLDFSSGSTQLMVISGSGNVGIGTTAPSTKLEISDSSYVDLLGLTRDGVNTANLRVGNLGSGDIALDVRLPTTDSRLAVRGAMSVGSGYADSANTGIANGLVVQGNVGIGTTSPGRKLTVAGTDNLLFLDSSGNSYVTIDRSATDRRSALVFSTAGDGTSNIPDNINWALGTADSDEVGDGTGFFIGTNTAATSAKLFVSSSGNVGIDTTSPTEKLDVNGNIKATKLLLNTTNTGYTLYSNGESRINGVIFQQTSGIDYLQKSSGTGAFYVRNSVSGQRILVGAANSSGQFTNYLEVDGANNDATIRTNDVDRLYISSSGNVGIGTTSPSDKLQVDGRVRIKSNDGLYIDTSNSYGANAAANFEVINDASSNPVLRILNAGNGGFRNISINTYGGKLGIGTLNPTETLTVEGNISGSGKLYVGTVDSNTTSTAALVLNGSEVEQRSLGNAAFQDTGSMTVLSADSATTANLAAAVTLTTETSNGNFDVLFETSTTNKVGKDAGGDFAYNPSTDTLTVGTVNGLATTALSASHAEYADNAGLATNAGFVDVKNVTTGTEYRVVFADAEGTGYEQMNVHDNGIEYDPESGTLRVSGDVVAYNSFSDRELKDNIQTYQDGLNAVMQLNPVTYEWKKGREGQEIGLIAQEVEKVIPQVVREQKRMNEGIYKTVDYEKLVAVLIDAVQDQQKQIDELKQKLDGITS